MDELTIKRQLHLDQNTKIILNERRVKELKQLEEESKKIIVKDDELAGRQSGSLAWRTSRGETGTASTMTDLKTNGGLSKFFFFKKKDSLNLIVYTCRTISTLYTKLYR